MYQYYTAVGRLQMKGRLGNKQCPMVILSNEEFILDLQEMMVWSVLNWRIPDAEEIQSLYHCKEQEVGYLSEHSLSACLHRLIQRGLVAEGQGHSAEEALYDLIAGLYIVPISENIFLRIFSFFKLTFINRIPYCVTRKILKADRRSDGEKKVMKLANQTLMSTAEMIKCVEHNYLDLQSEDHLVDLLYHDDTTTSDNIPMLSQTLSSCRTVVQSVANLYLRKQIIFERI